MGTNEILALARTIVLGAVSVFAVIVFPLAAHIIHLTTSVGRGGFYYDFAALGLAVAILTLLTFPAMLFISFNRKGALTSYIGVEVGWLSLMWILWLATGASVADVPFINSVRGGAASEAQTIEAFGFLAWILLMAYSVTLLIFAVIAHGKGHSEVWTSGVREFDFAASGPAGTGSYEQKDQYPPQGVPTQAYNTQPLVVPQQPQFSGHTQPPSSPAPVIQV
jgi:hypothetical protein